MDNQEKIAELKRYIEACKNTPIDPIFEGCFYEPERPEPPRRFIAVNGDQEIIDRVKNRYAATLGDAFESPEEASRYYAATGAVAEPPPPPFLYVDP